MKRDPDSGRRRPGGGRAGRLGRGLAAAGAVIPLAGCGLLSYGVTVTAPSVMTVSEGTFANGTLPPQYTCAGRPPSTPPLTWAGAPSGTKSIALVVDDSAAPITPYVYWVVFDIGPGTSALLEGQRPPGARQAEGTSGYAGYNPPCPRAGGHGYRFTVYALDKVLSLPDGASLPLVWQAIAAATIGRGRLTVESG